MLNRDVLTLRGLDRHTEIGTLVLRLFFAFVLIYGTQDNVFSRERMMEFRDFVAQMAFRIRSSAHMCPQMRSLTAAC